MKITVYSHFFTVEGYDYNGYQLVKEYAFRFAEYDYRALQRPPRWGQPKPKPKLKKIYAAYTANKREFRFHVNTLHDFMELLKQRQFQYELDYSEIYKPTPVGLALMDGYVPREDQEPLIDYLAGDGLSKVLNLQTGRGKTFCALAAAVKLNGKIFISIETRFFNLWREAMEGPKKILNVDINKEVLFIQGTKELRALLQLALDDDLKEEKVYIVAARTLAIFFEAYERYSGNLEGVYPIIPHEMYELLDIATRIKDEVHLSLFANFKEELYLHGPKSISLSATLEDGSFLDKILAIMFPNEIRSPEVEYLKYIEVYSMMYSLNDPKNVVTSHRGSSDYSHNAYEAYILSKVNTKRNYFKIIQDWLQSAYLDIKVDKQRACVFVSSVEMATALIEHLRQLYPHIHFERYAASAGDVYETAKLADVLITTVQSFGTGFDLDDLICSLLTTSLRSQKTNLQVLGRLRVLKNYPNQTPKFYYLVCSDIPKHLGYHEVKKTQFYGKVKAHHTRFLTSSV